MATERNWNAEVIAEFRANRGVVAAPYDDPPPMALLRTIGARSGREHVVPMRALPDGDALYVFATAHGSDRDPDWFHNVVANPDFTVELADDPVPVHATVLHGAERADILERWRKRVPLIDGVLAKTAREIPVIRLVPTATQAGKGSTMSDERSTVIENEVTSWPGVSIGDTGRGGLQFNYGRVELGHLHGSACADLPFPRKVRDELIAAGRASVHPPLPNSGWVRRDMEGPADVTDVIALFRLNYDRARARVERP